MSENPETIEISGLATIHKLCNFAADHNMEGCTFTDIVERMFEELKAQQAAVPSVPEGFVVVDLLILGGLHNAALDGKYLREVDQCQSKFEEIQTVLAELLEKAQENDRG